MSQQRNWQVQKSQGQNELSILEGPKYGKYVWDVVGKEQKEMKREK